MKLEQQDKKMNKDLKKLIKDKGAEVLFILLRQLRKILLKTY